MFITLITFFNLALFINIVDAFYLNSFEFSPSILVSLVFLLGLNILIGLFTLHLLKEKERIRKIAERNIALQLTLEKSSIGTYIYQNDQVIYVNNRLCKIFGFPQEFIKGPDFLSTIFSKKQFIQLQKNMEKRLEGTIDFGSYLTSFKNSNGEMRFIEVYPEIVNINGKPAIAGSVIDVTERDQLERKLEQSEQHYSSLFDHNPDAVYSMDPQGALMNINPALEKLLGYTQEEYEQMTFHPVIHPDYLQSTMEHFQKALDGNPQNYLSVGIHRSGRLVDLNVINIPILIDDEIKGVYGIAKDITLQKVAENKLEQIALTDFLTGLPNRYHFQLHLKKVLKDAKSNNYSVAIVFIDIDNFKGINDSLGHTKGDEFIIQLAEKMRTCLEKDDFISRQGGDEFLLLLENVEKEDIEDRIDRLFKALHQPFNLSGHEIIITPSVGIAIYPDNGEDPDTLIKNADMAMYAVKEEGKNNYHYYTDELEQRVARKNYLETRLQKALERNEFFLHYQPQFDLQNGRLTGAEALLRWNSENESISPVEFIPIAEDLGLIHSIGQWVLQEACNQMKQWRDVGFPEITISVNVSGRQLHDHAFVDKVQSILNQSSLKNCQLELEITESVMLDARVITGIFQEIKDLGVKISIDDFGAGHSSLNIIRIIDIDTLKLDKSLLDDMIGNPKMEMMISTIIHLGQKMQSNVVIKN
jgi:diguanylate cyclase (GGDEF)-like protein/PAS domain S-box-containing protein